MERYGIIFIAAILLIAFIIAIIEGVFKALFHFIVGLFTGAGIYGIITVVCIIILIIAIVYIVSN